MPGYIGLVNVSGVAIQNIAQADAAHQDRLRTLVSEIGSGTRARPGLGAQIKAVFVLLQGNTGVLSDDERQRLYSSFMDALGAADNFTVPPPQPAADLRPTQAP